jgi:DNA-binding GntR family transcriptional regulator
MSKTRSHADRDEVSSAQRTIRDSILNGQLKPDTVLSQVELATRLGVSRGPLREALRVLQREGFVVQESQHRARVAGVMIEDFDELYAMRIVLESLGIALAVPQMSAKDHQYLDELLERMESSVTARDLQQWEEPHSAFHKALVHPSGDRLEREASLLGDHAQRYRSAYYTFRRPDWEASMREHAAIADAARHGDADGAAALLAQHLARTALVVLSVAAPTYEPARIRRALSRCCAPSGLISAVSPPDGVFPVARRLA